MDYVWIEYRKAIYRSSLTSLMLNGSFSMWLVCLFFCDRIALTFPLHCMRCAHTNDELQMQLKFDPWSSVGWFISIILHLIIIIMYCIVRQFNRSFCKLYNRTKECSKWANFINYTDFCLQFPILWSSKRRMKKRER